MRALSSRLLTLALAGGLGSLAPAQAAPLQVSATTTIIADFVKATGKRLRGHNCVWHNQLPDWLSNGTFSAPELAQIVERHCFTLVSHYRGQVCG